MAICDHCDNDITTGASCVVESLHLDGHPYRVSRHGYRDGRCGDCGVRPGGFHHLGCDLQRCPACRGQLIMCDCPWEEFAPPGRSASLVEANDSWEGEPDDKALGEVDRTSPTTTPPPFDPVADVPRKQFHVVEFGAAAEPSRRRHTGLLHELAEWSLAVGRPIDLDIAAVLLELIAVDDGEARPTRRPDVHHLVRFDLHNWCAMHRTPIPAEAPTNLWTVLGWLAESERLAPGSDPLSALRDPLRCYAGLDAEGRSRPDGATREVHCQCWIPHDPTVPEGMIRRIVAERHGDIIATVHPPALDGDELAHHGPLLRLGRRLREDESVLVLEPTDWTYAGRSDPAGRTPALWFYRHEPTSSWGYDHLALSESGRVYSAVPDRRRKVGYRWDPIGNVGVWRAMRV